MEIAPAIAQVAMDSGVTSPPIRSFAHYRQRLSEFVYNSAFMMKPIFAQAKTDPEALHTLKVKTFVYFVIQIAVDEGMAKPILVGRPAVIEANIKKLGLRLKMVSTLKSS